MFLVRHPIISSNGQLLLNNFHLKTLVKIRQHFEHNQTPLVRSISMFSKLRTEYTVCENLVIIILSVLSN